MGELAGIPARLRAEAIPLAKFNGGGHASACIIKSVATKSEVSKHDRIPSRPTVKRALREHQLSGIIDRRAGSGSYVRPDAVARGYVFGLLIPELGRTEIFEPICHGMAGAQNGSHHALLWGSSLEDSSNIEEQATQACRQLVAKKVSGVFFAPLELTKEKDTTNLRLAEVFDKAGIPVVLLDRDLVPYPERSHYDLVGIDNRRAGYVITAHLLKAGCQRIVFIGRPGSAPTVDARMVGYKDALADAGSRFRAHIHRIEPDDHPAVKAILDKVRPDGFICANDFTAAHLLKTLNKLPVDHDPSTVRRNGRGRDQHHARTCPQSHAAGAGYPAQFPPRCQRVKRRAKNALTRYSAASTLRRW